VILIDGNTEFVLRQSVSLSCCLGLGKSVGSASVLWITGVARAQTGQIGSASWVAGDAMPAIPESANRLLRWLRPTPRVTQNLQGVKHQSRK